MVFSNPRYRSEEERIFSFEIWPKMLSSLTNQMVALGLFYIGRGDIVQCHKCGGRISDWNIGDDVKGRHDSLFVECSLKDYETLLRDQRIKIPEYREESCRRATFDDRWPKYLENKVNELINEGFFYIGIRDGVVCYKCGLHLWRLGESTVIKKEHNFYAVDCFE